MRPWPKVLIGAALAALIPAEASALITGGTGNSAIRDPGWPKGADKIFNHFGRVAWWEGPPFGGGQWHAECRGDAVTINAVLDDFAKLDAKVKRLVVHDGTGFSFWMNPNNDPAKRAEAKIDWTFTVWQPASWDRLRKLPAGLNPTSAADTSPPAQIDVYTTGVRWADVRVPQGIEVDDERLEAHGFTPDDGFVLEGTVTDAKDKRPLAATVRLQRVEPRKTGGYDYPVAEEARGDAKGHWVLKNVPSGWFRVLVGADGHVPRVVGFATVGDQARWMGMDTALAAPAPVSGRVTDAEGRPLPEVDVRFDDVAIGSGERYETPRDETALKTDSDGRFRNDLLPVGTSTIWIHKPGYCRPGLGLKISMPKDDVALTMMKSGAFHVRVDFGGKAKPGDYIVQLQPEGGDKVGSFGGSASVDAEGRTKFTDVPPGRYVLTGKPNPSSSNDASEPVTIDLQGGKTEEVTIKAR